MTEFNPFIKGEPPVSDKFNKFTSSYSDDINVIAKQIDYLSAAFINSHNLFSSEIQQENKFINRIKSKVKVLQMYSTSPSSDLFYFGNSFDSSDYIDFTKINNKDELPLISNGEMSLPVLGTSTWTPRSVIIADGSNGYAGNNHAAYSAVNEDSSGYRYFFVDNPTSRSKENIRDNNPLTFFEYEQVNIPLKSLDSNEEYEFKYAVKTQPDQPVSYDDWSTFKDSSLKLNLILEKEVAETANFILITPYFGSGNYISKDIIVTKIEVTNDLNQVENILAQPIYISSGLIPNSLDKVKNFYYKEAKVSFSERKVKQFKIYFEQKDSTSIKVKHVYYKPDEKLAANTPYANQKRFNPNSPSIISGLSYPSIGWKKPRYDTNTLIPPIDKPNYFKAEVQNTQKIEVKLYRDIPVRTGFCVKVKGNDGKFYRITNQFFSAFNHEIGLLPQATFDSINESNLAIYISSSNPSSNGDAISPYLSSYSSKDMVGTPTSGASINSQQLDQIVNWFNSSATKSQRFAKFDLDTTFNAIKEDVDSETKEEFKPYVIDLVRQYEILEAQRRSIGIRDITVGHEKYSEKSTVITKQYDTPSEIEYITISTESGFSGVTGASIGDYLKYYISLDDGAKWIQISSIENEFSSIPEVIAFNQNIDENFRMPGVSYISQPDIPASIKRFILKIEMTKPTGTNISPIVYSYKVGVKVKQ